MLVVRPYKHKTEITKKKIRFLAEVVNFGPPLCSSLMVCGIYVGMSTL